MDEDIFTCAEALAQALTVRGPMFLELRSRRADVADRQVGGAPFRPPRGAGPQRRRRGRRKPAGRALRSRKLKPVVRDARAAKMTGLLNFETVPGSIATHVRRRQ